MTLNFVVNQTRIFEGSSLLQSLINRGGVEYPDP